MDYNVTMGTTLAVSERNIDQIMEGLSRFDVAAHSNDHDNATLGATITVPATNIQAAIDMAFLAADAANIGAITSMEVLPTAVYDAEAEKAGLPELIGVGAAATLLECTRPTVRSWVESGKLKGVRIEGAGWGITRESVLRIKGQRSVKN